MKKNKTRLMAFLHGDGTVRMESCELPEPAPNEATIRVEVSLISPGTEMNPIRKYRAEPVPDMKPKPFGYACAGEITAVNGESRGLKIGDRVFAMGPGAKHANWINVPINLVAPLPERVSLADSTFACLAATSLHAVRRAAPGLGDYGLVLGGGIVGNLAAQLASLSGARVMLWESIGGRRKIARATCLRNLADPKRRDTDELTRKFADPYGFDFSIFAFGGNAKESLSRVQNLMKLSADGHRMGRIVLVGGCIIEMGGGAASGNLDILSAARTGPGYHDPVWEYGQDYPNAFVPYTTARNLRECLQLIAEKRLLVSPMITTTVPLKEINSAADLLLNDPGRTMGVIVEMPHGRTKGEK